MNHVWRFALLGAAVYLLFLALTAPAAKLLPWLQPQLPGLQMSGVAGSLWSGRAQRLQAGGVQLDEVHWHWRPLALFTGALEFGVEAGLNGQPLAAHAGSRLFSGPYLAAVTGSIPAADLLSLAGMRLAEPVGQVTFDIDKVTGLGSSNSFPAVAGNVSWAPARVLAPLELDLGQVQLRTRIEAGATRGQLVASGGVLAVNGDVTFNPDGSYQLVGDVRKDGTVPQAVDSFLASFAEFSNGSYRLEWSDRVTAGP